MQIRPMIASIIRFRLSWFAFAVAYFSSVAVAAATDDARPTVYLIGDSTVKCGRGNGGGGMYGWGQMISKHFDLERIEVQNRALGGRSSRTYLTEGLWAKVLADLQPGDFVLMQFGHNDGGQLFKGNRPRASIRGNGDETQRGTVELTGDEEVVHSYGWYLRRFITDTQQRGATPIVLSLVPRERWDNGRVIRDNNSYGKWAAEAAEQTGAFFVDLNSIVAERYERDGQTTVHAAYFTPADHTHTNYLGACVNAESVVAGLRELEACKLRTYLLDPQESIAAEPAIRRFDFGPGEIARGYWPVRENTTFSEEQGYGFEGASPITGMPEHAKSATSDACSSDQPFYFSVALPEGNYRVRVQTPETGDAQPLTIKAELRRLMIEQSTRQQHEFVVNVRQPALRSGQTVRLKERERTSEKRAWDDRLTLEFSGPQPAVASLEIEAAQDCVTVFLSGDSTVADQALEPWNSWGQMLPRFFGPDVAVANHAESGETIKGSLGARRLEKIFEQAKTGDYLLVQFGHNDMKDKADDALARYESNLKSVVVRARELGMTPVLVTSMERVSGITKDTLGPYPQTVRQVAKELNVNLIDLHTMSKQLYQAMGDDVDQAFVDRTHHSSYGSYQLAQCVVAGIRQELPELAKKLQDDDPDFDLKNPMPANSWSLPSSPQWDPAASTQN